MTLESAERGRALDASIDSLAKAAAERGRELDARIAALVSAIGELVRRDRERTQDRA